MFQMRRTFRKYSVSEQLSNLLLKRKGMEMKINAEKREIFEFALNRAWWKVFNFVIHAKGSKKTRPLFP